MFTLITEYPIWFILFCLLAGFIYAWILYRKDDKYTEAPKFIFRTMFVLRFLSVSLIAFFLLLPFIKTISKTIEKPIIVFAQDNSESVFTDSLKLKKYKTENENFLKKLKNSYKTNLFSFGDKITDTINYKFDNKITNISELTENVKNKYFNQNLGALIIASDGIYNKGENPLYSLSDVTFPVYTIALGDTGIKKDLILNNVKHNKIAFLNNQFPVQAVISAKKLKGKQTVLKVFDKGKLLFSKKIIIDKDDFFKKIEFEVKAEKTGVRQLQIVLSKVNSEVNTKNNKKNIVVEVINSKQKILILSNSPHPDISALKEALGVNQNFETEYYNIDKFNKPIKAYNLVILHQLPSKRNSAVNVLKQISTNKIPVLYILGTQTDRRKFDNLNAGIKIAHYKNSFDEVQANFNNNFNLFELNDGIKNQFSQAPPLLAPFGKYKVNSGTEILCYRTVKNIATNVPLIVINPNTNSATGKSAVITGEGIWKWKLFDYRQNNNHYLFNELINKIVQYLTLKINKDRFRVFVDKIIPENTEIIFNGEIYNKSYELVNNEDINLQISDSTKKVTNYVFEKSGKSYSINIGTYKPGQYNFVASTIIDGKKRTKKGTFTVATINIESVNTVANHKLLYQISKKTGGKMFYPNQYNEILKAIKGNENIVSISYREKKTENLINLKLLFFIILILLSSEWFMRKFHGGY